MTGTGRAGRTLLVLAAVAVGFAAADTYVVVLALPDMMTGVGVPIDQLQRAAPIVSGFLLGYVAMLPLIGRIADLRGRVPVLVMALVLFALGSLITTVAYDMPSIVAQRDTLAGCDALAEGDGRRAGRAVGGNSRCRFAHRDELLAAFGDSRRVLVTRPDRRANRAA